MSMTTTETPSNADDKPNAEKPEVTTPRPVAMSAPVQEQVPPQQSPRNGRQQREKKKELPKHQRDGNLRKAVREEPGLAEGCGAHVEKKSLSFHAQVQAPCRKQATFGKLLARDLHLWHLALDEIAFDGAIELFCGTLETVDELKLVIEHHRVLSSQSPKVGKEHAHKLCNYIIAVNQLR